tara:strand:- start:3418 stop:3636 length:219 start_codon:yes stop_codon:yes gene_type:complete
MENFKTSEYQRKAYKAYLERKKDDEEFKANRRQKQREYYKRNREAILAKKAKQYQALKEQSENGSLSSTDSD